MERKMMRICLLLFFVASIRSDTTLRLVNLVYRHGDRSPIVIFPTDPNQIDKWPQGLGWLSQIGMQQHYELGQWLRSRYIDSGFMSSEYKRTEIHIESSDEERCLMSAYCNLAGLFPPDANQRFNDSIAWQPIPVHTRPAYEDNMINMGKKCPRYEELLRQTLKANDVQKEEKENKPFYTWLGKQTKMDHENISNIWKISDTLFCEKCHNLTLANWTSKLWPSGTGNQTTYDKLRSLESFQFTLLFRGTEKSRLKGGPLLSQYIKNMRLAMAGNVTTKMFMYSGHDTTVAALLSVLGQWNGISPQYASSVISELHEKPKGTFYVNLFYKNVTDNDTAVPLKLQNCSVDCPFEDFVKHLQQMIPVNWDKECGLSTPSPSPSHTLATGWVVSIALGCILLVLIVTSIVCCVRYRRSQQFHFQKFDVSS